MKIKSLALIVFIIFLIIYFYWPDTKPKDPVSELQNNITFVSDGSDSEPDEDQNEVDKKNMEKPEGLSNSLGVRN